MPSVTVEIECQDEDNGFHTTYKVEKYPEQTRNLEKYIRERLMEEGIDHDVVVNPGPGKGWEQYHNIKGYYISRRDSMKKTRYPRLGAFEVIVKCRPDFAPARIPGQFEVWSKLKTRSWPDSERLARDIAELLVAGRSQEDVSMLLRKVQQHVGFEASMSQNFRGATSLGGSLKAQTPLKGRMFFGLAPRPVAESVCHTPEVRAARPLTPGRVRPPSAAKASAPAATLGSSISAGPARPASAPCQRVMSGAPNLAARSTADRPLAAAATGPSWSSADPIRANAEDIGNDVFEDDKCFTSPELVAVEARNGGSMGSTSNVGSAGQFGAVENDSPGVCPGEQRSPQIAELARRLYERDPSQLPRAVLEAAAARSPSIKFGEVMDLERFKNRLYSLGVFAFPYNFKGLYDEMRAEASLSALADELEKAWPAASDEVPAKEPLSGVVPGGAANPVLALAPAVVASRSGVETEHLLSPGGSDKVDEADEYDSKFEETIEAKPLEISLPATASASCEAPQPRDPQEGARPGSPMAALPSLPVEGAEALAQADGQAGADYDDDFEESAEEVNVCRPVSSVDHGSAHQTNGRQHLIKSVESEVAGAPSPSPTALACVVAEAAGAPTVVVPGMDVPMQGLPNFLGSDVRPVRSSFVSPHDNESDVDLADEVVFEADVNDDEPSVEIETVAAPPKNVAPAVVASVVAADGHEYDYAEDPDDDFEEDFEEGENADSILTKQPSAPVPEGFPDELDEDPDDDFEEDFEGGEHADCIQTKQPSAPVLEGVLDESDEASENHYAEDFEDE